MGKYIFNSIMGSLVIYALTALIFLIGAFLLWDFNVLLTFWKLSFAVFRVSIVASFIACIADWEDIQWII